MLKSDKERQMEFEVVCLEQLVSKDHLLRKVNQYIDFSFIPELVKPYYCEDNGRPSVEPIVLFKMLFIGYLYGIRSEHQLAKEIHDNNVYRWFLGLLTDTYCCPNGEALKYRTTNREGYREYVSNSETCKTCPLLDQCTQSKNHQKVITQHVWEESKEWVRMNRLTKSGKMLYKKRIE